MLFPSWRFDDNDGDMKAWVNRFIYCHSCTRSLVKMEKVFEGERERVIRWKQLKRFQQNAFVVIHLLKGSDWWISSGLAVYRESLWILWKIMYLEVLLENKYMIKTKWDHMRVLRNMERHYRRNTKEFYELKK